MWNSTIQSAEIYLGRNQIGGVGPRQQYFCGSIFFRFFLVVIQIIKSYLRSKLLIYGSL